MLSLAKKTDLLHIADDYALTSVKPSMLKHEIKIKFLVDDSTDRDDSKQKAWLEHYQRLLNAEFDWDPNHLSDESLVEGSPIPVTIDMVKNM